MNQILIFSVFKNARLQYVVDFIFNGFTHIPFLITDDEVLFKQLKGVKINYSQQQICEQEIQIIPNGLLVEEAHSSIIPAISWQNEMPFLFPSDEQQPNTSLGFDLFSSIFFLLSRYEEYSSPAKDQFGRFPATESIAFKNNFLHLPIIDIWLKELITIIAAKFPAIIFPKKKTQVNFTYDIDGAYAFKGRSFFRQLGAIGNDLLRGNFLRQITRLKVLLGIQKDPFDNYNFIAINGINPIFFFLLHQKLSPQDRNINPKKAIFQNLIKNISQQFPIGIHPSFHSSVNTGLLQSEKETLEQISGQPITKSRQHYLRFTWPNTYQHLLNNGIEEEYSMGYTQTPGFRAGTCTQFYFFDLDKNEATNLKIFPLCIMEATFRDHLQIPMQEALNIFKQYFNAVNNVQGHFICIWHNDTLQPNTNKKDPKNFRWLHEQIVGYIRSSQR